LQGLKKKVFYQVVILGPPSSALGGCWDAVAACSGGMLDDCIFSNKEQVTIQLAKKDVSILTPQA
jgi:hypothetical protein